MRLTGKVAFVTGSTQGIGRGIALRLAQEGADIIVAGHEQTDKARETADAVRAEGRRVHTAIGDVSKVDDCRRLIAEGIDSMGQIDILINNAGIQKSAAFCDISEEDFDRVLGVNLKGPFFMAQALVQHLLDTGRGGRIINTSSVHEELPFPNFTGYCASKGGLKMMMRNLAIELAPLNITVNNIAPGAIETPLNRELMNEPDKLAALLEQIPLNRLGKPADVAGIAAFLASDDAGYVTGSTFYVDGGLLWNYSEQ